MAKNEEIIVTEHIVEIRHFACGRFLDVRGNVADHILSNELFPHWQIGANVVNFRDAPDKPVKFGAFTGYKSAGFYAFDPETRNLFQDKAGKFWTVLIKNQFYPIPDITRFGCRTKAFLNSDKSFEVINNSLYGKFFSTEFKDLIGKEVIDLQIVVDLIIKSFTVKITCGPIHKDEAQRYFNFNSKHFSQTGIYLDIDVFKTNQVAHKDVPILIKQAMQVIWEKIDKISKGVGL